MKRALIILALAFCAPPVHAESMEELSSQLAAQKEINALLLARVSELKSALAASQNGSENTLVPAEGPQIHIPENERALERALQRRGSAVLPAGIFELAPSLSWTYSGSSGMTSSDEIRRASLDARLGLAGGWMIGATVPYINRDREGLGSNSGTGDISLSAWKSLRPVQNGKPSLVAGLRYQLPVGGDLYEDVIPLGSGYERLTANITTVHRVNPIAYYGRFSYTYGFETDCLSSRCDPGARIGLGAGAYLSVSPDISVNMGIDFIATAELEVDGITVEDSDTMQGSFTVGTGFIINRQSSLNLTASFGVTDDASDVTLRASMPFRF
jgi:hypothetical protein